MLSLAKSLSGKSSNTMGENFKPEDNKMLSLAKSFTSKKFHDVDENVKPVDTLSRSAPPQLSQLYTPPTAAEAYSITGDTSDLNSPTVVNNTQYPIVVFLERGILYNEQVLHPGEAVSMTKNQTGGRYGPFVKIPYKVHAVVGNEKALPTRTDSAKNLARVSIVPAAFVAGCMMSASSAGTLAGPSAALTRMVGGMAVRDVVIDAAAVAAGTIAAERAKTVADYLLKYHKENFTSVTPGLKPGQRYLSITGGLDNGPLLITEIKRRVFKKLTIKTTKAPIIIETDYKKVSSRNITMIGEETGTLKTETKKILEESKSQNMMATEVGVEGASLQKTKSINFFEKNKSQKRKTTKVGIENTKLPLTAAEF